MEIIKVIVILRDLARHNDYDFNVDEIEALNQAAVQLELSQQIAVYAADLAMKALTNRSVDEVDL